MTKVSLVWWFRSCVASLVLVLVAPIAAQETRNELDAALADLDRARQETAAIESRLATLRSGAGAARTRVSQRVTNCLSIREGPGPEHPRLDCLPAGTALEVLEEGEGWISVRTDAGSSGWVARRFVEALEPERMAVRTGLASCLNLRSSPARDSSSIACLAQGTQASVLEQRGGWFRLRLDDGRVGWSSGQFLEGVERTATTGADDELAGAQAELEGALDRQVLLEKRVRELEGGSAKSSEEQGSSPTVGTSGVAALEARLSASEDTVLALREVLTQTQAEAEAERQRLLAELGAARAGQERVPELEAAARTATDKASVVEGQVAQLESRVAESDQTVLALRQQLTLDRGQAEVERKGLLAELDAARAGQERVPELEAAARRATDKASVLEGQVAQLESRVAESEQTVLALRQQLTLDRGQAEVERKGLLAELDAARAGQERVPELEAAARRATDKASVLEGQVAQLESRVAESEQTVLALRQQLTLDRGQAEVERKRLLEELAATVTAASSAGDRNALLAEKVVELEEQIAASESLLQGARGDLSVVQTRAEELSRRLAELEVSPTATVAEALTQTTEAASEATDAIELEAVARGWAAAWSAQDVEAYFAFYSDTFSPADGMTIPAWRAQRQRRLSKPASIEVTISDLAIRIDGPDRAALLFQQHYRSNSFEERVKRTLGLAREGGSWKIVAESSR